MTLDELLAAATDQQEKLQRQDGSYDKVVWNKLLFRVDLP
jgi:hypothetical protein